MENAGELVAAVAVPGVLIVLFAVLAGKMWHGKWLHLIAGNNFIPEKERGSAAQLRLGKRVAVVLAVWCFFLAALPVWTFGSELGQRALADIGTLLLVITGLAATASLVWLFVAQGRDRRKALEEYLQEHPARHDDAKLDRRATVVLVVILVAYLGCIALAASQAPG